MRKYNWDIELIKEAVIDSVNFTEVLQKLGIPRQGNNSSTLKTILDNNNIDYSHFTGRARTYATRYVNASQYLNNTKEIKSAKLKSKLLKENLIENKCSICGIQEWLGKPIILQLHHIDGNNKNNSIQNLQLLCPNCHSQTENYCGKANCNNKIYTCKDCGKIINRGSTYCPVCSSRNMRRVLNRPTKEQLINDFKELKAIVKIGHKYKVTDNAIRKWLKGYGLPFNVKGLTEYINNNIDK